MIAFEYRIVKMKGGVSFDHVDSLGCIACLRGNVNVAFDVWPSLLCVHLCAPVHEMNSEFVVCVISRVLSPAPRVSQAV
jgi:hypothetical protein